MIEKKHRIASTTGRLLPVGVFLLVLGGVAVAQAFDVSWSVLPISGGESANESYSMTSTVGHEATMEMTNEAYQLQSGFIPGVLVMTTELPPDPSPGEVWAIH